MNQLPENSLRIYDVTLVTSYLCLSGNSLDVLNILFQVKVRTLFKSTLYTGIGFRKPLVIIFFHCIRELISLNLIENVPLYHKNREGYGEKTETTPMWLPWKPHIFCMQIYFWRFLSFSP